MTSIKFVGRIGACLFIFALLAHFQDARKPNPLYSYASESIEILKPSAYEDSSGTTDFPERAYDGDEESCAQISTSQSASPAIEYYGWSSGGMYSSLTLNVKRSASEHKKDTWSIKYSLDNGMSWQYLEGPSSNVSLGTVSVNLDPSQDLSTLRVSVETDLVRKPDNAFLLIYDMYTKGIVREPLSLVQSEFRFFENRDSADLGAITSNAPGTDEATAIAIDENYMYVAGFEPHNWRIEIRDLIDGTLLHSAISDCSGQPNAIIPAHPYIYVIGDDHVDGDYAWRIEKWQLLYEENEENGELVAVDDFGLGGAVRNNLSENSDSAQAAAIYGGFLYVAGSDRSNGHSDAQWRIEKRSLEDGSLVLMETNNPSTDDDVPLAMAISPDGIIYLAGFDRIPVTSTGPGKKKTTSNAQWRIEAWEIYGSELIGPIMHGTSNPSDSHDVAFALAIAPAIDPEEDGALFVAGSQEAGFFDTEWRIERRSLANLQLIAFPSGASGEIREDFGYEDRPLAIAVDDEFFYLAGHAAPASGGGDTGWRIEKRNLDNGDLVYGINNDPYPDNNDKAQAIAVNSERLYVAGYDHPGLPGWRMEIRHISDGSLSLLSPLANVGEPTTLSPGDEFRLRLLVQVDSGILPLAGLPLKLRVYDGSSYWDIDKTTPIAFLNNPTPIDGDALVPSSEDPLFGHPVRPQTYVESNGFTNSVSEVPEEYYAMWDFSLQVNDTAIPGHYYTFRIAMEDGTPLDDFGILPGIEVE